MNQIRAEYIDHMGDDLRVVNAARVSFDKESDWLPSGAPSDYPGVAYQFRDGRPVNLSEGDARLINYLASHDHWTPFGHCMITLRETVPIFVARPRFRHTVGFVYNEVSRRYVDSEPEFYLPDEWRGRAENKKQGSSDEVVHSYQTDHDDMILTTLPEVEHQELIDASLKTYREMLEGGICPEQARMVLPQSMMTSYYVTGSLAAFARAYKLRIDPHAQKEIQDLAVQWDKTIRPLFPVSWEALTK